MMPADVEGGLVRGERRARVLVVRSGRDDEDWWVEKIELGMVSMVICKEMRGGGTYSIA
jgi:hypothetical protein